MQMQMEMEKTLSAIHLDNQKGRALWHFGALLTFKALGAETNNQFWALEGLADRHMAIPLHVHSREDEIWYVVEGTIKFYLGDKTLIGNAGSFVYIPKGIAHSFQVISDTARWFGIGTPAGLDQWFFETGEPAKALTLPPPPAGPPDVAAIVASLKAYGTDILGPPPGM